MVNLTICTNHPRSRFQSLTCQNGLKFVIHPIQATGIRQQTILLEQMFMEIPSKMMLHGLSSLTIYSTRKCCFLMETNQHGWLWPKQQQLERITQMPREISWHLPSVENHLQPECITEEMLIQKILGSVLKIMQLKVGGVSNCMLYGENDTWGYTESKNAHGGADVYIKQTNW